MLAKGVRVLHAVDATKLAMTASLSGMVFDRIVFNFPHTGSDNIQRNSKLVLDFFANVGGFLHKDGQVHVTLFKRQFDAWNVLEACKQTQLTLVAEIPFRATFYPGYSSKNNTADKTVGGESITYVLIATAKSSPLTSPAPTEGNASNNSNNGQEELKGDAEPPDDSPMKKRRV
eukprot:c6918_g1_i2.p1 GENE.c6918_g1_i2~~c6918_g1_i2.p1  ORF type:complete len:174 (+),score=35.67 c6918_g1_i2:381-902(+)